MKKDKKNITRKKLFRAKEKFHKEQAKLPFREKLRSLITLQKIASHIKEINKKEIIIWKI